MTSTATAEPLKLQQQKDRSEQNTAGSLLGETAFWLSTQRESCHICGDLEDEGIVVAWHNFELAAKDTFAWQDSSCQAGLNLCLNLAGRGALHSANSKVSFEPLTGFLYTFGNADLRARRNRGEHHRFLTIGFSASFLRDQLTECERALHPVVRDFVLSDDPFTSLAEPVQLTREHEHLISLLLRPQCVEGPCQLRCKGIVLQLMADFLVRPCCGNESSCDRQKCLGLERARKVVAILERDLADPPSLDEIGHEVGCSPFYLSRTFSREMGMTIPQCLRTLRMRYAAELLKSGRCNVTEAAMAVGYSSLSHFSQAFCQTIGCCPNIYSSSGLETESTACTGQCSNGREQMFEENQRLGDRAESEIDVLLESVR